LSDKGDTGSMLLIATDPSVNRSMRRFQGIKFDCLARSKPLASEESGRIQGPSRKFNCLYSVTFAPTAATKNRRKKRCTLDQRAVVL
jgi:hypothetical protein